MSDLIATFCAYVIMAIVLWHYTRRSKSGYVRRQWRKPGWILLRLFSLFVLAHGVFVFFDISTAIGFAGLAAGVALVFVADFSGMIGFALAGVGFVLHEWVFWFPSRHDFFLRHPKPVKKPEPTTLIGLTGITLGDLKPTGKVLVEGAEHVARSENGFIPKGEKIVVTSVGAFEVGVRHS
jgi:membrane-bound ClpP family serine protease